jgi:hypothetical protein
LLPAFLFSLTTNLFFFHHADLAQRVTTLGPSSEHFRFEPTHTFVNSCLLEAELPVLYPSLDQRHQSLVW